MFHKLTDKKNAFMYCRMLYSRAYCMAGAFGFASMRLKING